MNVKCTYCTYMVTEQPSSNHNNLNNKRNPIRNPHTQYLGIKKMGFGKRPHNRLNDVPSQSAFLSRTRGGQSRSQPKCGSRDENADAESQIGIHAQNAVARHSRLETVGSPSRGKLSRGRLTRRRRGTTRRSAPVRRDVSCAALEIWETEKKMGGKFFCMRTNTCTVCFSVMQFEYVSQILHIDL